MSRSIHTTRRALERLRRQRFGDPARRERALEEARLELRRKRRIKRAVREERRRSELAPGPAPGAPAAGAIPVDAIPVEVADADGRFFHAVDEADVRALLRALPDAAEGIRAVRLSSGAPYIESMEGVADSWERDPFTGRFGAEMIPGVWSPAVLGLYRPSDHSVHVHAYVLERERFVLPERACELFVRVCALANLMHEVGHHHDLWERTTRGRWLDDDVAKLERTAERREDEWTYDFVLPHLLRSRPRDARELVDWLAQRAGARIELAELLRGGMQSSAYESVRLWLLELAEPREPAAERLSLAEWLHLDDRHELCLRVLDARLAERPDDAPALTLRADSLVHLERPREALAIADALRARGVEGDELRQVLCDALECLADWPRLLAACDEWRASGGARSRVVFLHRSVAHAALGDFEAMERCVHEYVASAERPVTPERVRANVARRLQRTARLRGRT